MLYHFKEKLHKETGAIIHKFLLDEDEHGTIFVGVAFIIPSIHDEPQSIEITIPARMATQFNGIEDVIDKVLYIITNIILEEKETLSIKGD